MGASQTDKGAYKGARVGRNCLKRGASTGRCLRRKVREGLHVAESSLRRSQRGIGQSDAIEVGDYLGGQAETRSVMSR